MAKEEKRVADSAAEVAGEKKQKSITAKWMGLFAGTQLLMLVAICIVATITSADKSIVMKLAITGIVIFIICLLVALKMVKGMSGALLQVSDCLGQIAQGNLQVDVTPKTLGRKDVVGTIGRELDCTITKLKEVVSTVCEVSETLQADCATIEQTSEQTSESADEISQTVEEVARGAIAQAGDVEEATKQINELGEGIVTIIESVGALNRSADNMMDADEKSATIMQELADFNDKTIAAIQDVNEKVNATDQSVELIQEAVTLISAIAEETNLLSLNASIEAARAGEAGRGFAVVATEIQKLADESQQSANRIAEVIEKLSADSKATVSVMQEMETVVEQQHGKLEETRNCFAEVSEEIKNSIEQADQIRANSDTCNTSRAQVVEMIQNLSAISQENAATIQETNASMEELNATISLIANKAKELDSSSAKLAKIATFYTL